MSERTEKEILSKIEDYSRETAKNTRRTAENAAFFGWLMIISIVASVIALWRHSAGY